MRKGVKIALVGPPHSGKSVFRSFLETSLPGNITTSIISAPDGEGKYSNRENQEEIQAFRVKGKYSNELIEKTTKLMDNINNKIVIVDTGGKLIDGRLTKENKEILSHCTHAIVLSSDETLKNSWEKECNKMGLDIIASLDSSLEGKDEKYTDLNSKENTIYGKVTNLERGKEKAPSLLLNDLLERILAIAKENNIQQRKPLSTIINSPDVINMHLIGEAMGIEKTKSGRFYWNNNKLPQILEMLDLELNRQKNKDNAKIYTANPNWLTFAVTERALESGFKTVKIYNSKNRDFQEIPIISQHTNEDFKKIDNNLLEYSILPEDKAKLLVYENNTEAYLNIYSKKGTDITLEDLKKMNLPNIDIAKDLFLSYITDNYFLVNSVSSSYVNVEKNIADIGNGFITYKSPFKSDLGKQKDIPNSINHLGILNKMKKIYEEREQTIEKEFEEKKKTKFKKGRVDNFDKNRFKKEHIENGIESEHYYESK